MAYPFRTLGLLIYKNLLVRKRHWLLTIILQAVMPIALFSLIQAVRDFSVQPPRIVNDNTYYPIQTQDELIDYYLDKVNTHLYFVPRNTYTEQIMEETRKCLGLPVEMVAGFPDEEKMVDQYIRIQAEDRYTNVLAVVFEKFNSTVNQYKIRHSQKIPHTLLENEFDYQTSGSYGVYYNLVPFAQIQMCVDESIISYAAKLTATFDVQVSIQRTPYPPHIKVDDLDTVLRTAICTFAVIAFLIPLCVEANYGAKEKFIGVNVLMAMNGVKLYQNLLSWLITGVIFSVFYVAPVIILFKITFSGNVDPYLYYSNGIIFGILLFTHVAHLLTFGMHISAYFAKPRFVLIVLSIVYTAALSLHGFLIKAEYFTLIPYLGLLFPNICLYRILEEVNAYESKLTGVQWSNMFIPGQDQYNITGSTGFIFLFSILGIILHFTLAVYFNAILPGKYGVRKDPLYFLKSMKSNRISLDEEAGDFDYDKIDNEDFEPVERGVLTPGIQIRNLKKRYTTSILRNTTVQALKGISMDLYKGQITALLGHNGAGKTTLMSILTGVTSPTEGKVFINGRSIKTDMQTIRNDLGLCPQENMVFPDLNVIEQLQFFGRMKGINKTRKEINDNVNRLLHKLKLFEKRYVLPSKLSGGQKRRLCLGMALIGDASIIVLDEPTSGMDPETRRDTWDIILKMRGEKTILISTHNMEEADILGDRIAIVHGGKLRSYGTAMFLKKQYGHGKIEVTLSTETWCNPDKIMHKFDPRTQQISVDKEKIVLDVPFSDSLPDALDSVENQKNDLGVTGISVSLITLEQVFLKIVKKDDNGKHLNELFTTQTQKATGWELCFQRISALLQKKFAYARKNLSTTLMTIFFPILSVLLLGLSYENPTDATDVFPIKLDMYRSPDVLYTSDNDMLGNAYKSAVEYFHGAPTLIPSGTSLQDGLLNYSIKDIASYRNNLIAGAEFNISEGSVDINAFYSGTAVHSVPISLNLLSNAIIKTLVGKQYSIHIASQQLPTTLASSVLAAPEADSISRVLVFCGFFFPTVALFLMQPFQETTTKVKQLQRMTGISSVSYWGTMFSFDYVIYLASSLVILLGFYIMDVILDVRLYQGTEISLMLLMLLLFGINALLIGYIFTFLNKSRNTISTLLGIAPLGLVLVQYLAHMVLHSFRNLKVIYEIQKALLRLLPYVSLFHCQVSFYNVAVQNARCRRLPERLQDVVCPNDICCGMECKDGHCKNPLPYFGKADAQDVSLKECLIYLAVTPILYAIILILLEERVFPKLFAKLWGTNLRNACSTMDEQVKKEKHMVSMEIGKMNQATNGGKEQSSSANGSQSNLLQNSVGGNENNNLFLVYELSKYYGKLMAVQEISFRVKQQECFGLLGVNGAGKSTTFRMLTGEEIPNSGNMYLGQSEIQADRENYLSKMGYCPQTDALLNSLDTFDHLRLFAMLRGIPKSKVDLEVNKWINRLNLNACMSQPSGTYSGGNKRRLNIAMALIGNPTLVLLDEPTTGVDPAARRSLWQTLQSCQAAGQAIILTSHSMEECEALCNRLVIMVKGQLVCIGPSQELKQRFGAGYDIHIKLNPSRSDDDVTNIKATIQSSLTCDIRDENLGYLAYHVSHHGTTWKKMYSTMNDLKARYSCIDDYAVLSATLEQLFIQFARGAEMSTQQVSPNSN